MGVRAVGGKSREADSPTNCGVGLGSSLAAILPSISLNLPQSPCLLQVVEPVSVQTFIPKPAVEAFYVAFDVAVLDRLTRSMKCGFTSLCSAQPKPGLGEVVSPFAQRFKCRLTWKSLSPHSKQ